MMRWRTQRDLDADRLILFTIQAKAVYDQLAHGNTYRPARNFVPPDFAKAYAWMGRQMDTRLGQPDVPDTPPVWLWARLPRKELQDEARRRASRDKILIEVAISRREVLMSHFDYWHDVLNEALHIPPQPHELTDTDAWWARAEPMLDDFDRRAARSVTEDDELSVDLRRELEDSWVHIFDPATWDPRSIIQAVARELRPQAVVRAYRCGRRRWELI